MQDAKNAAERAGTGEEISNNDLKAQSADLEQRYGSAVSVALGNTSVKAKWGQFERAANKSKTWHNLLGTTALLLLIFSLLYAVLELVMAGLRQEMVVPEPLENLLLGIGMAPVLIAILLSALGVRKTWVLARYKAERIRHWQFHQLLSGPYLESLVGGPGSSTSQFDAVWRDLMDELNRGHSGLEIFIEHGMFRPALPLAAFADDALFRQAVRAYYDLRLKLQIDWFTQEKVRYEAADSRSEAAARALLVSGAALTFLEAGVHFTGQGAMHPALALWIPAGAIMLLLLSAGVRVYRSASGISESAERYKTMQMRLLHFGEILDPQAVHPPPQAEALEAMLDVERLCHAELVEFLRVSRKSDYLI